MPRSVALAFVLVAVAATSAGGCDGRMAHDPPPPRAWASSPSASAQLGIATSQEIETPAASASASAEAPAASASVAPPSMHAAPSASASAAAPVDAIAFPTEIAPPKLRVYAIGLHIGGGPNDDETKDPIQTSIAPRLADLKRCWPWLDAKERRHGFDFGVDLTIEADGGKAQVRNPRGPRGASFQKCVVAVYASIDFKPPKTGRTQASYSVHFVP